MALQRNDILWSGVLEDFFEEFLRFVFKDADKLFDFRKGFVFMDKALAAIFPVQEVKHPKVVDKLVKVHTKNGGFRWFLVHVEVQGYLQSIFTRRVFTYYYKILEKYNVPVTCIVVYLGKRNKSNASFYASDFLGTSLRFEFNTYYILEQNEEELKQSKNPFAIIVLAALMALKYKGNVEELYASKVTLVKMLLQSGLYKNKIRHLLDFIKLYINFDNELNAKFDKQIELLTGKNKRNMGIREQILDITKKRGVEIGEKRGLEIGEKRGLEKGEKRGLEKGQKLGLRKGETKTKIAIARKMKLEGISQALIAKFTGLTARQIRLL